ncbi:MAG: hypothetical protein L6Q57_07280 [Alphaproteobacteria bacterium]|nr:hypothetical protein [Alphaproteobacteria bacterium]
MKERLFLSLLLMVLMVEPASAACPSATTATCAPQTTNPLLHCYECRAMDGGKSVSAKKCRRTSIDIPDDATLEQQARDALCSSPLSPVPAHSQQTPPTALPSGRLPNPLTSPLAN